MLVNDANEFYYYFQINSVFNQKVFRVKKEIKLHPDS
jgi:hypothetical protein